MISRQLLVGAVLLPLVASVGLLDSLGGLTAPLTSPTSSLLGGVGQAAGSAVGAVGDPLGSLGSTINAVGASVDSVTGVVGGNVLDELSEIKKSGRKLTRKLWRKKARRFCRHYPGHPNCRRGKVPDPEELNDMVSKLTGRIGKFLPRVPRIHRHDPLQGIDANLRGLLKGIPMSLGEISTEHVGRIKDLCKRRKCRDQPANAKKKKQLITSKLIEFEKRTTGKDNTEGVQLRFDRTLQLKQALLEKGNLSDVVEPLDDGVFDVDMMLTENQANILLNELGKGGEGADSIPLPETDSDIETRVRRASVFFDGSEQVCSLSFGPWTFQKEELQLSYLDGKKQVELNDYSPSGVWDVIGVPGMLTDGRSKITYQIHIRRKALFYTVILIMPTVLMAFLSMMVYYLPAESSEKITLAISLLLALVVFLLVVSKILPPTSSTIPLMAKYLLMVFIMNMITIMVSVVIINVYFRGPATHTMPPWVKQVFLKYLPMILIMRRPESTEMEIARERREKRDRRSIRSAFRTALKRNECKNEPLSHPHKPSQDTTSSEPEKLSVEATKAIEAIQYITMHLTHDNAYKRQREEWKYVSVVIDRLLLYIFFAVTTGGTMGILFSAPNVFEYVDQNAVIEGLKKAAAAEMLQPSLL